MESLGEVLKQWPVGNKMSDKARQLQEELLVHPLVVKLRAKYPELSEDVIRLNLNRVYQYTKEHGNCSNCPGLDRCPNDFEGHYTMLSSESQGGVTQLVDRKVPCKKIYRPPERAANPQPGAQLLRGRTRAIPRLFG